MLFGCSDGNGHGGGGAGTGLTTQGNVTVVHVGDHLGDTETQTKTAGFAVGLNTGGIGSVKSSPAHLRHDPCPFVRHRPRNPSCPRQESVVNDEDFSGEVLACPVVGPFGWPKAARSSLTAPTVVPAKEKKKTLADDAIKGGGI